jgi:WD40 repeat protein
VWAVTSLVQTAQYRGHERGGYWAGFSPDGTRLASASWDGKLRVWDLEARDIEWTLDWGKDVGERPIFAFGTDSRYLLYGSTREDGGIVGAVDLERRRVSTVCQVDLGHISAFARSPRGDLLAAADDSGRILVWALRPDLLAAGP